MPVIVPAVLQVLQFGGAFYQIASHAKGVFGHQQIANIAASRSYNNSVRSVEIRASNAFIKQVFFVITVWSA